METPVTWNQLIIACIFILVTTLAPQIYQIYSRRLEAQEKKRIDDEAAKEKERSAQDIAEETTWKRVVSEYDRALAQVQRNEEEIRQLRPLALQNAILEQKILQCKEDKEDWKAHAIRLEKQLTEKNIIPVPFRRNPREDTGEQLKTISQKMKTIKDSHAQDAPIESPTLTFPPVEGGQ